MTAPWNDLASGPRWRGIVCFIRNWVGPFRCRLGMASAALDAVLRAKSLTLPAAVREWYLLAAKWNQGGLNVWIRAEALEACDGMVCLLTDTHGVNSWGVRVGDVEIDDPPVFALAGNSQEIDFPTFSALVAAMIVNDVIFGHKTEAPVELNPISARADLTCLVRARCGDVCADAALESATVVTFAYPGNGPVFGKSRTPAGHALLHRLRLQTA